MAAGMLAPEFVLCNVESGIARGANADERTAGGNQRTTAARGSGARRVFATLADSALLDTCRFSWSCARSPVSPFSLGIVAGGCSDIGHGAIRSAVEPAIASHWVRSGCGADRRRTAATAGFGRSRRRGVRSGRQADLLQSRG